MIRNFNLPNQIVPTNMQYFVDCVAEFHVMHTKNNFFRRKNRNGNNYNECKQNSFLTNSNRTSCTFCRYKKCISIGINPSSVMASDELNKVQQKRKILHDNTNAISIQDACIKKDYSFNFDATKMLFFSRDVCQICGATPVCKYFEGNSSRACFGFFKRSVKSKNSNMCKEFNKCLIHKQTRNECQSCRCNKCLRIGMNPDKVSFN